MIQLIFLLLLISPSFFYFRSIIKKNENLNNTFKPKLLKIIIFINFLGVLSFLFPWINLPFVGGKSAIDLTSKVFSSEVQILAIFSIFFLSFFYLTVIIGSFLQLKNKLKKSKFTINFEASFGLLITLIGILTIFMFNQIWNSPSNNIPAMSASPGFGLYLILIIGITQIIALKTIEN